MNKSFLLLASCLLAASTRACDHYNATPGTVPTGPGIETEA